MPDNTPPNNPATELRTIIREDKDGNLSIEYQAYISGTEVTIDMRPAHVVGKLYAGAFLVLAQKYKLLEAKPAETSNSIEGKKSAKSRRH